MRPRRIGAHCSAASTRDPFDSHNRRALALALALALDLNLNPPTRAAAPVTSLTAAALAPLLGESGHGADFVVYNYNQFIVYSIITAYYVVVVIILYNTTYYVVVHIVIRRSFE